MDVDHPRLMQRKVEVIKANQPLLDVLPNFATSNLPSGILGRSEQYVAVACDLKQVSHLDRTLRQLFDLDAPSVAILFVTEVSLAYMERHTADAVLKWAARFRDGKVWRMSHRLRKPLTVT